MNVRFKSTTIALLMVFFAFSAADARGQGLIRRLRTRLAPVVSEALQNRQLPNTLPPRPVPPAAGAEDAGEAGSQSSDATSRYQTLARPTGVERIPSLDPRYDGAGDGSSALRQSSGVAPVGPTSASSSLGKSILSPLGVDEQPRNNSRSGQASLGIGGVDKNPGYPAVQVTRFSDYSLAARTLRVGDYIFAVNAVPTPTVRDLATQIAKYRPGDRVKLRVGRGGRVNDVEVELAARPSAGRVPNAGLNPPTNMATNAGPGFSPRPAPAPASAETTAPVAAPAPPEIGASFEDVRGRRGVIVKNTSPDSIAARAGLQREDRIVAIDRRMVSDLNDLSELLALAPEGSKVDVQVIRRNQLRNLTLEMSTPPPSEATSAGGAASAGGEDATATSKTSGDDAQPASDAGGSVLGGIGSVFGGLLGSSKTSAQGGKPADGPKGSTKGNLEPASEAELPAPVTDALSLGDDLSLPTESPVTAKKPESGPAAEVKKAGDDSERSKSNLKEEIKLLRDQLKRLEEKLEE